MKARLYLLEGTYPSKVIIKNNLIKNIKKNDD